MKNHSNYGIMFNNHKKQHQKRIAMIHNNYNTEKKNFKHLNYEKRKIIERLLNEKFPKVQIAKFLGIARSILEEQMTSKIP